MSTVDGSTIYNVDINVSFTSLPATNQKVIYRLDLPAGFTDEAPLAVLHLNDLATTSVTLGATLADGATIQGVYGYTSDGSTLSAVGGSFGHTYTSIEPYITGIDTKLISSQMIGSSVSGSTGPNITFVFGRPGYNVNWVVNAE